MSHGKMLDFVKFEPEKHYDMIRAWWIAHGLIPVPLDALPANGIIVGTEGKLVCASFIYSTDSSLCYISMHICDPAASKVVRNECLDAMFDAACTLARMLGFKSAMSPVNQAKMISRLKKNGFIETDKNVTHMLKVL